jgi:sugar lactone lactonase YvrE
MQSSHQVVTKSLNSVSNILTTVAGTGCYGSTSYMLNTPYGIFVDTNFDLYVADCYNQRIQLFQSGQLSGLTLAGSTTSITTITLSYPTGIVLDADKYLFIVDNGNGRIVGSGPNGFRCLVGCLGSWGSTSNQLYWPISLSFDSYGNMFVTDTDNSRIQKFILLNNTHGKYYKVIELS